MTKRVKKYVKVPAGGLLLGMIASFGLPAASFAKTPSKHPRAQASAMASPSTPAEIENSDQAVQRATEQLALVRQKPESPDRNADEARFLFYRAMFSTLTDAQKLPLLEEGAALAESAMKKTDNAPGPTLWWSADEGAAADITRSLGALKKIKIMEDLLIKMKYSAPEFLHGGAQRVLARIYQRAPRIISVGSMSRAEENFDGLLKSYGDYAGNWLFYADFLLDQKKKPEAIEALKKAASLPTAPSDDALDRYYWKFFRATVEAKLSKM